MTAKQTIDVDAVGDPLKVVSLMLRIADPQVDAHPFKLYMPVAWRILDVYSQVRGSTGTDTVTFTIMVAGADLTEYQDLLATQSSGIQTTAGTEIVANDVAIGEVVEVDITALGGTGHDYFDVQITGVLQ